MAKKSLLFSVVTLLLGGAGIVNSTFGAYLPEVGPSPLRFRASPAFVATIAAWPPLRLDDSTTDAVAASAATNLSAIEHSEPFVPPYSIEDGSPQPDIVATGLAVESVAAGSPLGPDATATITPQMLVDFFKPLLNGTNAVPVTSSPGPFIPPEPPPSSSAIYKKTE